MKNLILLISLFIFITKAKAQNSNIVIGYNLATALHHDEFTFDLNSKKIAWGIDFGRTRSYGGHFFKVGSPIEYTSVKGHFIKIIPKYIAYKSDIDIVSIGIGYLGSFYTEKAFNTNNGQQYSAQGFSNGIFLKTSLHHFFRKNWGIEIGNQTAWIFRKNHIISDSFTNQPGAGARTMIGNTQLTFAIIYKISNHKNAEL